VTHQIPPAQAPGLADAGGQVAQLHRVLGLVAEMAGGARPAPEADRLDAAARVSAAYQAALPIDQRRFDRLALEAMAGATAGVEALLAMQDQGRPCAAAASVLAETLERALKRLAQTVYA
jgi:regulator of protease activity HflC (stomatin/prohibitin superfamily)